MTTQPQPQAPALANALDEKPDSDGHCRQAATLLRTQHAEIERLNACIKWEQNRAERIGTHGPGCEKWGPAHYECALRAIERKDALLRQALEAMKDYFDYDKFGLSVKAMQAITKELSQ